MSAIVIDGDLIHYEKLGRGRPVILVHGWLGSWRYWIPLMQQLHLKYSVYTLDLFGFGDSAKNAERYGIEAQVAMLSDFMEQLGIPKAALIGHSLGAMVVTEFALRHPDRAARVMLASAPLFDPGNLDERVPPGQQILLTQRDRYSLAPNLAEEEARAQAEAKAESTAARIEQSDRARLIERARLFAQRRDSNPLREHLLGKKLVDVLEKCFKRSEAEYEKIRPDAEKTDEKVISTTIDGFEPGEMLDKIRRISAPLLVVHGTEDPLLPVPTEDVWHYLSIEKDDIFVPIPLPGVRHFPMLEYEPFPRLTTDFLETVDLTKLELRERWRRRSR